MGSDRAREVMSGEWEPAETISGRAPETIDPRTAAALDEIRASAGKWQAAQLGIIGLISVVGLVKGGSDIRKLPAEAGVTIGVLLGLAFFAALIAIYLVSF